jgi:hypothetical protein
MAARADLTLWMPKARQVPPNCLLNTRRTLLFCNLAAAVSGQERCGYDAHRECGIAGIHCYSARAVS